MGCYRDEKGRVPLLLGKLSPALSRSCLWHGYDNIRSDRKTTNRVIFVICHIFRKSELKKILVCDRNEKGSLIVSISLQLFMAWI